MRGNDDQTTVSCEQCNARFANKRALGGHKSIHSKKNKNKKKTGSRPKKIKGSPDGKRACELCGKVFRSLKAVCGHMASHPRAAADEPDPDLMPLVMTLMMLKQEWSGPRWESSSHGEGSSSAGGESDRSERSFRRSESPAGSSTNSAASSSNNKDYECPICHLKFSCGQAMGGHKRSHYTAKGLRVRVKGFDLNRSPMPYDD